MLIRAILPDHALSGGLTKVVEGDLQESRIQDLNDQGYSIYYLPNHPRSYDASKTVDGTHIDVFEWVFVDCDLKDGVWTKDSFLEKLLEEPKLSPTRIVDSGGGIHAYWLVADLDAMSYLRLQRRLCRYFKTDEAVSKIFQLMRLPGYVNTKREDDMVLCQELHTDSELVYSCETLDGLLPLLTPQDAAYCQAHYDKTYRLNATTTVSDKMPLKFMHLLKSNKEVKEIWASGSVDDRSKADFRLGHIMFGNGLSKDEAMSVLINTPKALARAPVHRITYAEGIVNQIWTFELEQATQGMSSSVRDILRKSGKGLQGTRFPCHTYFDNTSKGYRLGQVIGLVAGVGVGKTAVALNMFMGFVRNNPDYVHFFIPLEQPREEIAERWVTMCGDDEHLYDKVQILSNYAEDGSYRNLSLDEIKDYILEYQKTSKQKVGAVVIDHIGVLKKQSKDGENQGLMDICHHMKAFAIATQTLLIMQSQAPREKAGIGDLELDKDAAYGTVFFEAYCDYLITIWQPLKRAYKDGAPTVTAYKFCKIRHKKKGYDVLQEDVPYAIMYDPSSQLMREMTQAEEIEFNHFNQVATNARKKDKKTDLVTYTRIEFNSEEACGKSSSDDGAVRGSGTGYGAVG